ncbi:MAG: potassium channel family protein [Candidatus Promineifilaceae bacterium]|nr:potassium channel family protein [Candidatus Promineifilaceae bacterium]
MPTDNRAKTAGASAALEPLSRLFLLDVLRSKDSRLVFYWTAVLLTAGTLVFHWLEGWSLLDSFYFCVITLTTVGYGDLSPTTPLAKVVAVIYVLNGIAILLMFLEQIRTVRTRERAGSLKVKSTDDS